jgi:hypothetical protein
MTRQPDLPDLGGGPALEHALLARAFHLLLDDRRPVSMTRLAQALASEPDQVERTLARLDRLGRIQRDQTGAVTGSHGLSLTPTPHELVVEDEFGHEWRYWTWCAWDAVGILSALDASGRIRSTSPSSGAPIQLDFHHGSPQRADPDLVVFFATPTVAPKPPTPATIRAAQARGSVIDEWCPLVNFFERADVAQAWAAKHAVRGTAVPLAEATNQGKAAWRRWIADHAQPAEPIDPVESQP